MENRLIIKNEGFGDRQRLYLEGRLDATWSGHLDDYLNNRIREGDHRFIINMSGIQYLSSAGIRILISQYKNMKKLGGVFVLEELSKPVSDVLEMAGMKTMLTEGIIRNGKKAEDEDKSVIINGFRFSDTVINSGEMSLSLSGDPQAVFSSGYGPDSSSLIKFSGNQFSIGLGAIGSDFDDCRSRFGEYIALGDTLAYKPSDGSKLPDYLVRTGRLEPEINSLYSLTATGNFSRRMVFEPEDRSDYISLNDLAGNIAVLTGYTGFVFLSIAECGGLVGMSFNESPAEGGRLFSFPDIRDAINFTTEPAWQRMLTVSLGFCIGNPDDELKKFLRISKPGSDYYLHTHTAVFTYQALPKNEMNASALVRHLFESAILQDVMHLIYDSREISGLGDSTFRHGIAWIGKLS